MKHSHYIVDIILVQRIPRKSLPCHELQRLFHAHLRIDSHYLGPVRHDILGLLFIKRYDVRDHLCLVIIDNALFLAFIHYGNDLFLGHIALEVLQFYAEGQKQYRAESFKQCA